MKLAKTPGVSAAPKLPKPARNDWPLRQPGEDSYLKGILEASGTTKLQNGTKIEFKPCPGVLTSAESATKVREVRRPLREWSDSELAKAQADILEYEVDDDIWPQGRPQWTLRVHRASYEAAYSVDPAWAEKTIKVNPRDVFLEVWREIALRRN
jgi:hypothetical protein